MPSELIEGLSAPDSKNDFIRDVLSKHSHSHSSSSSVKSTVGGAFRVSLGGLMEVIGKTQVHYVRCIKPNEHKRPGEFHSRHVLAQMRACGVIQTIRISAAGYPTRWSFEDFGKRYGILLSHHQTEQISQSNLLQAQVSWAQKCRHILEYHSNHGNNNSLKDEVAVGKTRVFLKAGILSRLEGLRTQVLHASARSIQAAWRTEMTQVYVQKKLQAIKTIQAAALRTTIGKQIKATRCLVAGIGGCLLRRNAARLSDAAHFLQYAFRRHSRAIQTIQAAIKARNASTAFTEQVRTLKDLTPKLLKADDVFQLIERPPPVSPLFKSSFRRIVVVERRRPRKAKKELNVSTVNLRLKTKLSKQAQRIAQLEAALAEKEVLLSQRTTMKGIAATQSSSLLYGDRQQLHDLLLYDTHFWADLRAWFSRQIFAKNTSVTEKPILSKPPIQPKNEACFDVEWYGPSVLLRLWVQAAFNLWDDARRELTETNHPQTDKHELVHTAMDGLQRLLMDIKQSLKVPHYPIHSINYTLIVF